MIDEKTYRGFLKHYGDAASEEFFKLLGEHKFCTTKCKKCGEIPFPPRTFCPACFDRDVEWVNMPGEGTLYAFTSHGSDNEILGLVDLEGIGLIYTQIDADFTNLEIGQKVAVDYYKHDGNLTLHKFRPV